MRIPIRLKLTAALAVPMVALIGVASYEAIDASDVAEAADTETELAVAALGPASLVSQLQIERNWSGVDQIGMLAQIDLPVSSMEEARANTDAALAELQSFVAGSGPDVRAAFTAGLAAMDDLAGIRGDIDASTAEKGLANSEFANEVFDRYSSIVGVLLDDTTNIALSVDDAVLRTGIEVVDLATREYEVRANTVRHILLPLLTGTSGVPAQIRVGKLVASLDEMDAALLDRSSGAYAGIPEFAIDDPRTIHEGELFDEFVDTGSVDILELAASISSPVDEGYLGLRTQAADRLRAEADAVVSDAEAHRRDVLTLAAGIVLFAFIVTWLASRSVTRPLRSLTRQARRMADEHLPTAVEQVLATSLGDDIVIPSVEPIKVRTRDEVGDVAAVLNVVQQRALDLAVEQAALRHNIADSFVNLGRRNQNLVGRQLDFITELEREESDPETLESLFRLDHLATRMRRNAESLLRLAGGEPTSGWDGPVTMLDVVRGALGEIEDYTRVDIRHIDSAALTPGVGADLSHALAELLENALTFSPPHDVVEVRGRRTTEGYVLAIIDNGVGMPVDELARANKRLAGEESFTVAPSRYLGHYVAGHLTSRLDIKVQLQPGAAGGITARIDIPTSVLVDDAFASPAWTPEARPDDRPELPTRTPAAGRFDDEVHDDAPTAVADGERTPWPVPWGDDDAAAADAAADAAPVAAPMVAPSPPKPEPAPGFGGLAPVAVAPTATAEEPEDDGSHTPSGLVRRVPGAQPPVTGAPFVNPMNVQSSDHQGDAAPSGSSPEEVSSFLAEFAFGVDRGLADAAEGEHRNGKDAWQ